MIASFVIPVFNVEEEYLRACMESLLNVTCKDIEFIIVDDGSHGGLGEICDEYAEKDPRVTVIHKENEGVSIARNTGVKMSKGKYITFIDSDDWIESSRMDELLEYIGGSESDVIAFGQYINYKNKEPLVVAPFDRNMKFSTQEEKKRISAMVLVRGYDTIKTSHGSGVFCNAVDKFIKKDLFLNAELRFDAGVKIGEDNIFYLDLYQKCETIEYRNLLIYHYRMRKSSACHSNSGKVGYESIRLFYDKMGQVLMRNGLFEELKESLLYRCYDLIFEQFVMSFVSCNMDFKRKYRSFVYEMKHPPFKDAIKTIDYRYLDGRDRFKAFLLKNGFQGVLFILLYYKRGGKKYEDAFY